MELIGTYCLNPDTVAKVLILVHRPYTPLMRVRTKEEALIETPYLEVDDVAWLKSLRSWLSDYEWKTLMVGNPRGCMIGGNLFALT